jgi:hypothetical protein
VHVPQTEAHASVKPLVADRFEGRVKRLEGAPDDGELSSEIRSRSRKGPR